MLYSKEEKFKKYQHLLLILVPVSIYAFPYIRYKVGTMPIYLLDIVIFFALVKFWPKKVRLNSISKPILWYVVFSFFSFLAELTTHESYETVYFFIRWLLSYSLLIFMRDLVNSKRALKVMLITLVSISLFDALGAILYSLPLTRNYVDPVFTSEILYPQTSRAIERLDTAVSQRGICFAGPSTLTSFYVYIGMCILLFNIGLKKNIREYFGFPNLNRLYQVFLIIIFITGALISLSRAAFLTTAIYISYLIFTKTSRKIKSYLFFSMVLILGFLIKSDVLEQVDYSRITETTEILSSNREVGYSEIERLDAYVKPFIHLAEYPFSILFGHGMSDIKVGRLDGQYNSTLYGKVTEGVHGLPGAIIYARGFFAFFFFVTFLFNLTKIVTRKPKEFGSRRLFHFLGILFVLNFLVLILTEHWFVDNITGSYQLFFMVALILILKKTEFLNHNNKNHAI